MTDASPPPPGTHGTPGRERIEAALRYWSTRCRGFVGMFVNDDGSMRMVSAGIPRQFASVLLRYGAQHADSDQLGEAFSYLAVEPDEPDDDDQPG